MRRTLTLFATVAFALSLAGVAGAAPALDKAGKCRDGGKFVAASMCKTAAPEATAAKAPKNCKKGKPCGNTCISMKDTCHIK
jgi:hypothetical protein